MFVQAHIAVAGRLDRHAQVVFVAVPATAPARGGEAGNTVLGSEELIRPLPTTPSERARHIAASCDITLQAAVYVTERSVQLADGHPVDIDGTNFRPSSPVSGVVFRGFRGRGAGGLVAAATAPAKLARTAKSGSLVLAVGVTQEVTRYGTKPTKDGFPLYNPTRAETSFCNRLRTRFAVAATTLAIRSARVVPFQPRPPIHG